MDFAQSLKVAYAWIALTYIETCKRTIILIYGNSIQNALTVYSVLRALQSKNFINWDLEELSEDLSVYLAILIDIHEHCL